MQGTLDGTDVAGDAAHHARRRLDLTGNAEALQILPVVRIGRSARYIGDRLRRLADLFSLCLARAGHKYKGGDAPREHASKWAGHSVPPGAKCVTRGKPLQEIPASAF